MSLLSYTKYSSQSTWKIIYIPQVHLKTWSIFLVRVLLEPSHRPWSGLIKLPNWCTASLLEVPVIFLGILFAHLELQLFFLYSMSPSYLTYFLILVEHILQYYLQKGCMGSAFFVTLHAWKYFYSTWTLIDLLIESEIPGLNSFSW